MPEYLIPPIITKPTPLLSTPVDTYNPRRAESTRSLRGVDYPLLILGRKSFLHDLIDFLCRKDTIESFMQTFRRRDVYTFAPIA